MSELAGLIAVPPDVHQAHRSVETVEHNERQREMVQNAPQLVAIEVVSLVLHVRILDREGIIDPKRNICNC